VGAAHLTASTPPWAAESFALPCFRLILEFGFPDTRILFPVPLRRENSRKILGDPSSFRGDEGPRRGLFAVFFPESRERGCGGRRRRWAIRRRTGARELAPKPATSAVRGERSELQSRRSAAATPPPTPLSLPPPTRRRQPADCAVGGCVLLTKTSAPFCLTAATRRRKRRPRPDWKKNAARRPDRQL
jgi:hypothetical protein